MSRDVRGRSKASTLTRSRFAAILLATVGSIGLGAVAWAYFSSQGVGSGSATVSFASLDHISIDPTLTSVLAGQPVDYVVTAHDTFGGSINVTGTANLAVTNGGCDDAVSSCTSDTLGHQTVTATYDGKTAKAVQVVGPAATSTALNSSVNPSVTGQGVTYGATVSVNDPGSGTPTGYVEFLDGATPIEACGGASGVSLAGTTSAACTLSYPATGSHTISAQYLGDGNYSASTSSTLTQVVGPAATSTALNSSVNPSVTGQGVTYGATVSVNDPGSGTPTGYVEFLDGATPIEACGGASGVSLAGTTSAACTLSYPATGSHTISAQYLGDGNYSASTSSTLTQVVGPAATSTALNSSVNPSVTGQGVTYGATVSVNDPGSGTPTGYVEFLDGATPIEACGGASGVSLAGTTSAACTLSYPATGSHTISAQYLGDGNYSASTSSTLTQVVGPAATSTALNSSVNPSVTGQGVTYGATVSVNDPGSGTPTGYVEFLDGATPIEACGGASGVSLAGTTSAACTLSYPATGSHTISAQYLGDGNYSASTSSTLTQVVGPAATSTALNSSVNPSVTGQGVTYGATVSVNDPGSGTPTGYVEFLDGATPIEACGGASGVSLAGTTSAACTLSYPATGSHTISAQYLGDGNYSASTSSTLTQVVGPAATSTALNSSVNPSVTGQGVTYGATVSVNDPGSGTPTGYVEFLDGATPIEACGGASGVSLAGTTSAACTLSYPATGSHTISAQYLGDGNYSASTSSTLTQVVGPAATSATGMSTDLTSYVVGQTILISATVTPVAPGSGTPTGTVTVSDGGTPAGTCLITLASGTGSCSVVEATPGVYTFAGNYSGDTNFTSSSGSALPVVVAKAGSHTVISDNAADPQTGSSFAFTVRVSAMNPGSGIPEGTIAWNVTNPMGEPVTCSTTTLSNGEVSCTITKTVAGVYSASAVFTDSDGEYANSSSGTDSVTVARAPTNATITSISPAVAGQSFLVSVSVAPISPGAGTPTGTVTVSDGSHSCTVTLSGGAGSCHLADSAGAYTVSATYDGDSNFLTSTTSQGFSIGKSLTSTSITAISPAVTGQPFAVTVSVAPVSPGLGTPTGSVTISDGTNTCSVTLAGASGSCDLTDVAGAYAISATYNGDPNFLTSSTSQGFTVTKAAQSITFTSTAPSGATVGGPTYSVAASGGASGNPVTFTSATLKVCTVAGSTVTFVGAGTCTVDANQAGNSSYLAAPQATQSFVVNAVVKCKSDVYLSPKYPWPVVVGTSAKYVATVQELSGSGSLSGTVTFYVNGVAVTGCTNQGLTADSAACVVKFTSAGSFTVTATYSGDRTFPGSSDSSVQVVNPGTTSMKLTPSSPVEVGSKVTYSAAVTVTSGSGQLSGKVSFVEGGAAVAGCQGLAIGGGAATCTLTFTAGGSVTVAATYAGDANFLGSSASVVQVINVAPLAITTSSLADATRGQSGYAQALAGTGGKPPYKWSIASGNLPAGLSLNTSTGLISGSIGATATSESFTVRLTDAQGSTTTKTLTIAVKSRPSFTCGNSATGTAGRSFTFQVTATGTPEPTLSEQGRLPAGLTFDAATGVLAGTPVKGTSGAYNLTFTATNSSGAATLAFTLKF